MCALCLANIKLMCLSVGRENQMQEMNVKKELASKQVLPAKTCKFTHYVPNSCRGFSSSALIMCGELGKPVLNASWQFLVQHHRKSGGQNCQPFLLI